MFILYVKWIIQVLVQDAVGYFLSNIFQHGYTLSLQITLFSTPAFTSVGRPPILVLKLHSSLRTPWISGRA
jgi:hypothetical protein